MRRNLLVALLFASLVGAGGFAIANSDPAAPTTSGPAELTDAELKTRHASAAVAGSPDALGAVVGERAERLGELARSDARSARHARPVDWAIAVAVVTAAIAALAITLARRRTGHAAVRVGRVAPSRAPPLAPSFA